MNYFAARNVPINQLNRYNEILRSRQRYTNWANEYGDEIDELIAYIKNKAPTPGTVGSYSSITNKYNNIYRKGNIRNSNPLYQYSYKRN